jgi:ABC-2 type transport system ATP-binding protein
MAGEGRTVLVSSHVMSEVEHTADRLVVIGGGRLLAETTTAAFLERHAPAVAFVRTPQPDTLARVLGERGARLEPAHDDGWIVRGADAATVGDLAAGHGIPLRELRAHRSSLEDVYIDLVGTGSDAIVGRAPVEAGR